MKTAIIILSDPKGGDKALASTAGLANLRRYLAEGWQTLVF